MSESTPYISIPVDLLITLIPAGHSAYDPAWGGDADPARHAARAAENIVRRAQGLPKIKWERLRKKHPPSKPAKVKPPDATTHHVGRMGTVFTCLPKE